MASETGSYTGKGKRTRKPTFKMLDFLEPSQSPASETVKRRKVMKENVSPLSDLTYEKGKYLD